MNRVHTSRIWRVTCALVLGGVAPLLGSLVVDPEVPAASPVAIDAGGWRVPLRAADERNPIGLSDEVLARGERTYRARCQRCHGPAGRGDGPEADPDRRPGDLTDPVRATRNPDGVVYYKIWNGRRRPDMPAFSSQLSRDEVWEVVHYIKTFRRGLPASIAWPRRVDHVSRSEHAGATCGRDRLTAHRGERRVGPAP